MFESFSFEDLHRYSTLSREPFFDIAKKYISKNKRVLDVGAGMGAFAERIGDADVYLVEGNSESVDVLRRKYENVTEITLPNRLPFEDRFFDLIHCSHVIEHLPPTDFYATLKEFDRCLGPGGYLVISAPLHWEGFYHDLSHVKPYAPEVLLNYFADPAHESVRTRSLISQDYKNIEIVYRYRIAPIPYLNISYDKVWAQKLLYYFVEFLRKINVGYFERNGFTIVIQKGLGSTLSSKTNSERFSKKEAGTTENSTVLV